MRVASNYVRLASTLVIGLILTRILLCFGDDAFGLIALLGTGTGIALVFKTVVRTSTVPILGEAFHSTRSGWFKQVLNAALLCSSIAGFLTLGVFAGFALCLDFLTFPKEFYSAALIFVIASGVHSFINVAISPLINFYIVSERMVAYNLLLLAERVGDIIAAITTFIVIGTGDASGAVMLYGCMTATFYIVFNLIAAFLIIRADRKLEFNFRAISSEALLAYWQSVSWNACVIVAINLYARVDMFIMNAYFGLIGSTVFSLANQAVGYLRQLIFGLVSGMDAVAARMSKSEDRSAIVQLMSRFTRIQALIVFPAMTGLLFIGNFLIELWLRDRLLNPETTIPLINWIMRILVVGVSARCLSECWMSIMNGSGNVKRYAIPILTGGLLNPILSIAAITYLPDSVRFAGAAFVFSTLMTIVHLIAVPKAVANTINVSFSSVLQPIVKPLILTVASASIAYASSFLGTSEFAFNSIFLIVFSCCFAVGAWVLILDDTEREQLLKLLSRFSPLGTRRVF